jgi:3-hydroxyisobutyrate dehydrogenase-like beta-hydroxyacid dehydrogenase
MATNLRNMSNGTYHGDTPEAHKRSQGTATLAHKDLTAAIELARELGVDLPVAEHIESIADLVFGVQKAAAAGR